MTKSHSFHSYWYMKAETFCYLLKPYFYGDHMSTYNETNFETFLWSLTYCSCPFQGCVMWCTSQEKRQIFVVVIQKGGFVGGPRQSFFWYDTDCRDIMTNLYSSRVLILVEPCPPILLLVWQWQKIWRSVFLWRSSGVIYPCFSVLF